MTPKLDSTRTPTHAEATAVPAVNPMPRKLFMSIRSVDVSWESLFLYSLYFLALPLTISAGYLRSFFFFGNEKNDMYEF